MKLKKAIDNIFSHNETIGIWKPEKDEYGNRYSMSILQSMHYNRCSVQRSCQSNTEVSLKEAALPEKEK